MLYQSRSQRLIWRMSIAHLQDADTLRIRAKTIILRWFDKLSAPVGARAIFSRSIDTVFAEIAERDAWFEVMTVKLDGTHDLSIYLRSSSWRAYPCLSGLAISTVVPGWAKGWRRSLRDDVSYENLTWFLHYARQYIHRSHVAKLLMVAWDHDRRVLHPFGSQILAQQYNTYHPAPSTKNMLDVAEISARSQWGNPDKQCPSRSIWATANTLDPNLHQAIFHFNRAHSLLLKEFELEAIVAFDCSLQAIKTMLVHGEVVGNGATRTELCAALGLGKEDAAIATEGHFLRNKVGAHAGGWRWWDSGEFTEDLVPAMSKTVRRALGKAAKIEPSIRRIDPSPSSWSDWLLINFETIWEIVWFEKIHSMQ